jgi:nitrite reductase (NADH) small subunit
MTTYAGDWVRITRAENIPLREGRSVTIGGRELALFNLGGRFVAMENRCPHRGGPLADGIVSSTGGALTVTCPLHNWRVAVDGGSVVKPSGQDAACVRTYPVRVDNGIISVALASEASALDPKEAAALEEQEAA